MNEIGKNRISPHTLVLSSAPRADTPPAAKRARVEGPSPDSSPRNLGSHAYPSSGPRAVTTGTPTPPPPPSPRTHSALARQNAALKQKNAALGREVTAVRDELFVAHAHNSHLRDRVGDMKKATAHMREAVRLMCGEKADLNAQAASLTEQVSALSNDKAALIAELTQARGLVATLGTELALRTGAPRAS